MSHATAESLDSGNGTNPRMGVETHTIPPNASNSAAAQAVETRLSCTLAVCWCGTTKSLLCACINQFPAEPVLGTVNMDPSYYGFIAHVTR
jgi:hypothetical protein